MEDHSKAVSYFEKAVKMAEKTGDENLPTYLVNLGMARIRQVCYFVLSFQRGRWRPFFEYS